MKENNSPVTWPKRCILSGIFIYLVMGVPACKSSQNSNSVSELCDARLLSDVLSEPINSGSSIRVLCYMSFGVDGCGLRTAKQASFKNKNVILAKLEDGSLRQLPEKYQHNKDMLRELPVLVEGMIYDSGFEPGTTLEDAEYVLVKNVSMIYTR